MDNYYSEDLDLWGQMGTIGRAGLGWVGLGWVELGCVGLGGKVDVGGYLSSL